MFIFFGALISEFFREKLERDGYKVEKTVSTVPIPGVNVPMDYGK